jgi:hypothetical protein
VTQAIPRARPARSKAARSKAARAAASGVAPLWVRGAFAAVWAVTVGLATLVVVILVMWAADTRSSVSAAATVRFAVVVWLSAMHVPMRLSAGGSVALAPLGLSAVLLLLLARAASLVARGRRDPDLREAATIVGLVVAPYTVLSAVLAVAARSAQITPSVPWTVVAALLTGTAAAGAGVLRGSGLTRALWQRVPEDVRGGLGAGAAGVTLLLGVAVMLLVGSLALHSGRVGAAISHYGGGPAAGASLIVACLTLLPNAVLAALGYLVGPGFALGTGTSYTLGGVHGGRLPVFPLLAAHPHGGAPASVLVLCVVAVVLAGVMTGWRVARRASTGIQARLRQVGTAAAAAGVSTAALVAVAGGPAGPGRFAAVGA